MKVIATAKSGIRVVSTGFDMSRQPTNGDARRGIGIKRPGDDTWGSIEDLEFARVKVRLGPEPRVGLPRMGMPPRAPEPGMAENARRGVLEQFFRHAEILRADYIVGNEFAWQLNPINGVLNFRYVREGPPNGEAFQYEYETQLLDSVHVPEDQRTIYNLYYIRLLPMELPSYHFWVLDGEAHPPTNFKGTVEPANLHLFDREKRSIDHAAGRGFPSTYNNPAPSPPANPLEPMPPGPSSHQAPGFQESSRHVQPMQPRSDNAEDLENMRFRRSGSGHLQVQGYDFPPNKPRKLSLTFPNIEYISWSDTDWSDVAVTCSTTVRSSTPMLLIARPQNTAFIECPFTTDVEHFLRRIGQLYNLTQPLWSIRVHPNRTAWDLDEDWEMISSTDSVESRYELFTTLAARFVPDEPAVVTFCPVEITVSKFDDLGKKSFGRRHDTWDWYVDKKSGLSRRFHSQDELAEICIRLLHIDPRTDPKGVIIVTHKDFQDPRSVKWTPSMDLLQWQKEVYYPIDQNDIFILPGGEEVDMRQDDFDRAIEEARVEKVIREGKMRRGSKSEVAANKDFRFQLVTPQPARKRQHHIPVDSAKSETVNHNDELLGEASEASQASQASQLNISMALPSPPSTPEVVAHYTQDARAQSPRDIKISAAATPKSALKRTKKRKHKETVDSAEFYPDSDDDEGPGVKLRPRKKKPDDGLKSFKPDSVSPSPPPTPRKKSQKRPRR